MDQGKFRKYMIEIEEGERQAILLCLAEMSIARPGWLSMLEDIALKMDNKVDGKAQMFENFRLNHSNALANALAQDPSPAELNPGYAQLY